jgi:hypothetical protein
MSLKCRFDIYANGPGYILLLSLHVIFFHTCRALHVITHATSFYIEMQLRRQRGDGLYRRGVPLDEQFLLVDCLWYFGAFGYMLLEKVILVY